MLHFLGKLDKGAILKAICAGFEEKTEPPVCLSPGLMGFCNVVDSTVCIHVNHE